MADKGEAMDEDGGAGNTAVGAVERTGSLVATVTTIAREAAMGHGEKQCEGET